MAQHRAKHLFFATHHAHLVDAKCQLDHLFHDFGCVASRFPMSSEAADKTINAMQLESYHDITMAGSRQQSAGSMMRDAK